MNLKDFVIVIFLFLLTFLPRLYKIDNPIADWHSWRQADTAAVSRNFIKEGLTPFYPKFDSLNSLNAYSDQNPNRYFFAEFPIYNLFTYPFYKTFGVNELWARLVSVIFSSLTSVFLYFLVKQFSSKRAAFLAGAFFAIIPFSIYYGRVVMPDPTHIFFSVLSLYLIAIWTKNQKMSIAILAGLASSITLLTKPYGLILILPAGYLMLRKWGFKLFKNKQFYIFTILTLLPFGLWRWHINQHPEGMFGTDWLFNQGNIRFTGAFFRWLVFERMNKLIFATGGFVLFFLGLIRGRSKKEGWFYFLWLLAVLIYFVVIAKGNVTHDYYQMPILPIGAILMAKGFEFLLMFGNGLKQRIINFCIALGLVGLMLAFGWYEVRGFFNVNHWEIVKAGQAVDKLLPQEAKIIAPYSSDSAFLYQTNRYGWTVGNKPAVEKFIEQGATHLVSVNFDEDTNYWMSKCKTLEKTHEYVIIDLKDCCDCLNSSN
jgi:dolichyl-phosphate-mannose-protein mannosyltransferase